MLSAGCASSSADQARTTVHDVDSAGCFLGKYHLAASESAARPGELVTLSQQGVRGLTAASIDSWGLLGNVIGGRFVALWNLAAITQSVGRTPNVRVGSSTALAGVGLPNRPFQVEVPSVASGHYLIQFGFTVSGPVRSRNYTLCTPIEVAG